MQASYVERSHCAWELDPRLRGDDGL
jgi:hypothetical protein